MIYMKDKKLIIIISSIITVLATVIIIVIMHPKDNNKDNNPAIDNQGKEDIFIPEEPENKIEVIPLLELPLGSEIPTIKSFINEK